MRRILLRGTSCVLISLAGAFGVAACGGSKSSSGSTTGSVKESGGPSLVTGNGPIVIADVQPPEAEGGFDFTSGMLVEANKLNKEGGVDGHKIEVKVFSEPGTPAGIVAGYRAAAADQSAIGTFVGDAGDELKPLGAQLKLPALTATGTYSVIEPAAPYIFSTTWGPQYATSSTIWGLKHAKGKKIALLHYNADFSETIPGAIKELCKETGKPWSGCEIVDEEASTAEASVEQLTPQLAKMKASKPDVYYIEGLDPNGFKAAKQLGMMNEGIPVVSDQWLGVPAIAEACGENCNGAVFGGHKCRLNGSEFKELNQSEPVVAFCKTFVKEWEAAYPGKEFAIYSIYGHDTVEILATVAKELLEAKKPVTRAAVAESLEHRNGTPVTSHGAVSTHPGDPRLTGTWHESYINTKLTYVNGKIVYSLASASEQSAEVPEKSF